MVYDLCLGDEEAPFDTQGYAFRHEIVPLILSQDMIQWLITMLQKDPVLHSSCSLLSTLSSLSDCLAAFDSVRAPLRVIGGRTRRHDMKSEMTVIDSLFPKLWE